MKTLLITGATSGIGLALATLAASREYRVIACGRNAEVLAQLEQEHDIHTLTFDVTDVEATHAALNGTNIDIAVLNAGVCEYVDVENFEAAMFKRVFDANFFGVIHCVEALLPGLQSGSHLVMVDSLARLLPFTRSEAYGASKAALHYFCKSLSVDLADRGIRVQSCSPGFVETPLTDKNDFEMPMRIGVDEAAEDLLKGIEQQSSSIYFPTLFSGILRALSHLPHRTKVWLCKKMNFKTREKN